MSIRENGNLFEDDIEVADDENYTDKKIKNRLLNTRELLIEAKTELETKRLIEPDVEYGDFEAYAAWANLIQSYFYELGVLLNHPDVPQAQKYREDIELGSVTIIPQDTQGIPFSNIVYETISEDDIIQSSSELGRGCDLPKPKTRTFTGLMDIARTDIILEERWMVTANPRKSKPNQTRIEVVGQQPVPKEMFQKALVESDQFLQNVGIGLDIQAEPYTADGEPGL